MSRDSDLLFWGPPCIYRSVSVTAARYRGPTKQLCCYEDSPGGDHLPRVVARDAGVTVRLGPAARRPFSDADLTTLPDRRHPARPSVIVR